MCAMRRAAHFGPHGRLRIRRRPHWFVEQLEQRLVLATSYDIEVLAQSGGTLSAIKDVVAINDAGEVAFAGGTAQGDGVFVADAPNTFRRVSATPDTTRFYDGAAINDSQNGPNQLATRERQFANFVVRKWDTSTQDVGTLVATNSPEDPDVFTGFLITSLDLNDKDEVVFVGLDNSTSPATRKIRVRDSVNGSSIDIIEFVANESPRPQLSNTTEVVFRSSSGQSILKTEPGAATLSRIAGVPEGFTVVGVSPGISDDGRIVTFYGDLDATGAAALGTTPGKGIFASVAKMGGGRDIVRIAGESGNGQLDPGETFDDLNGNGMFDPSAGEMDRGVSVTIKRFDPDARVGVESMGDNGQAATIAFVGFDEADKETVYTVPMTIASGGMSGLGVGEASRVVGVGDSPNGLSGAITDLNIYDPINETGQVAVWLRTGTGSAVVRAKPASDWCGTAEPVAPPITIRGQKFEDLNANGRKDPLEPGLPGWTIELDLDSNGSVDGRAVTDANGNYSFQAVIAGPNVNISQLGGDQAEVTIGINSTRPANLVVTSNGGTNSDQYTAYIDTGVPWTARQIGNTNDADGVGAIARFDGAVAYDRFGNVHAVYLADPGCGSNCEIRYAMSSDGGQSYTVRRNIVTGAVDKPWIATGPDAAMPGNESVWITYSDRSLLSRRIFIAAASVHPPTGGSPSVVDAFVGPTRISDILTGSSNFAVPAVGPNGQVVVTWQEFSTNYPVSLYVDRDLDGLTNGLGFGTDITLPFTSRAGADLTVPAAPAPGHSAFASPYLAFDRSGGPRDGRLYLAYLERPTTNAADFDTDVYVRCSDNNGSDWSRTARPVNEHVGSESQFHHAIAVDQANGDLWVSWYDTRNSGIANDQVEYFASTSLDGGLSFYPNVKVSAGTSNQSTSNPIRDMGNAFGDYTGIAAHQGLAYPVWADNSRSTRNAAGMPDNPDGLLDVYTAQITLIRPGTHTIREVLRPGYVQSFPAAPGTHVVAVSSGQTESNRDFGNFRFAEIRGTKFIDLDADGVHDFGEDCPAAPDVNNPGCQGITIHLFGTDGMGQPVHEHTTTNANGDYSFMGVKPGEYTVCEQVPAKFTQSFPASGADCSAHPATAGGRVRAFGYQRTLESGAIVSGRDFGNFSFAEIHGRKFIDFNANGRFDPGENCPPAPDVNHDGCAGITIHVVGTDGMGQAVHRHDITDPQGFYWFTDLKPGQYTVCEEIPDDPSHEFFQSFPMSGADCTSHSPIASGKMGPFGYDFTGPFALTSDKNVEFVDFGNFSYAEIHGRKFIDSNANGQLDPGEGCPPQPDVNNFGCEGITIHLFGTDGMGRDVHEHATTDKDGKYWFMDMLKPGEYTVCEEIPDDPAHEFFQSFPMSGADCTSHSSFSSGKLGPFGYDFTGFFAITSDEVLEFVDFGNYSLAEIHGRKFIDSNGDGQLESGEGCPAPPDVNNAGCQGITIHLFGKDGMDKDVHQHTTTDARGEYWFMDLKPGEYTVCEEATGEFLQSMPGTSADCSSHSPNAGAQVGPRGYDFTGSDAVTSDEVLRDVDFGNFSLGEIRGTKFIDRNANGNQDPGENCPAAPDPNNVGCQGITIHLFGTDGMGRQVHEHTITDANGDYRFIDLTPGLYRLCEEIPTAFFQSAPRSGVDCSPHSANGSGKIGSVGYEVMLTSDEMLADRDFGNYRRGGVSGKKFLDSNPNGMRELGEPPLIDWTIFVDANDDGVLNNPTSGDGVCDLSASEPCTLTDRNGDYVFPVLNPGLYRIREVLQPGWVQTAPPGGFQDVFVFSGLVVSGGEFGNFPPPFGQIRGRKFEDVNGNGARNAGEPFLPGWTIFIDADGDRRLNNPVNGPDVCNPNATEICDVTDSNGNYVLRNVPPGTHVVREVVKPGWVQIDQSGWGVSLGGAFHLNTGTRLAISDSDDQTEQVTLSFSFPFAGSNFTDIFVSTNGFIWLGADGGAQPVASAASLSAGFARIAPFWTDLNPSASGDVFFSDLGDRAIVTWDGVTSAGGGSDRYTFQVQLFPSGEIVLSYDDITQPHPFSDPLLIGLSPGGGVADPGETDFSAVPFNTLGTLTVYELIEPSRGEQWDFKRSSIRFAPPTTGGLHRVTLAAGEVVTGKDFRNFKLATITGRKFEDVDGNGRRDPTEPGLKDWAIFIDSNADGVLNNPLDGDGTCNSNASEPCSVTDASGNYTIGGLFLGSYRVREVPQVGWRHTSPNPSNLDVLSSGQSFTDVDFGNVQSGPPNNDFSSAQTIAGSTGSIAGSNVDADVETAEPIHAENPGGASVWYRWIVPISGFATIDTIGSSFDTLLAVYTGSSVSSLTEISQNDDLSFPTILTSGVTFGALAGNTYEVAVDGFNDPRTGAPETGDITLHWSLEPAPTVQFSAPSYNADEATGSATVTVTLSSASSRTVTVDFSTSDSTATAPSDYTAAASQLRFKPGETNKTFVVKIHKDRLDETEETVDLTLTNSAGAVLAPPSTATLTIEDDDPPPLVRFKKAKLKVNESAGTALITVVLGAASGRVVTVNYATSDGPGLAPALAGLDYTATISPPALTFPPGAKTATFTVPITNDPDDEPDETFTITLSGATNGTLRPVVTLLVTIRDDDKPSPVVVVVAASRENRERTDSSAQPAVSSNGRLPSPHPASVKSVPGPTARGDATHYATSADMSSLAGQSARKVGDPVNSLAIDALLESGDYLAELRFDRLLERPTD